MINLINAKEFKAVPYLESSLLMQNYPNGVEFSSDKPNVIVGPNGAGKSALLKSLSLHTLTHFTAQSSLDNNYLKGRGEEAMWAKKGYSWSRDYEFLPGMTVDSDFAPALFYRPHHMPGNERMVASAMMMGYFEEAKTFGILTREKSSGQQCLALLEDVKKVLNGDITPSIGMVNWGYGVEIQEQKEDRFRNEYVDMANHLKQLYLKDATDKTPTLILDEPEQSLDALAEAKFWGMLAEPRKPQVIIATHSLFPIMHPELFNLIEAVPGYAEQVRALINPRFYGGIRN